MALKPDRIEEIENLVDYQLDEAQTNWAKVGRHMVKSATLDSTMVMESMEMQSLIPDHEVVFSGVPKVQDFVALVVDIRKSTSRLSTHLRDAKANGFERIYYETSALLPALAKAIAYEKGSVTEYLGDGVLALFSARSSPGDSIKAAFRAAEYCINDVRNIVNEKIKERFNLPPLDLGAGLAFGPTMVTLVGTGRNTQPKALGPCIYDASKLSGGVNKIIVSTGLRSVWPKGDNGNVRFEKDKMRQVDGFTAKRNNKKKEESKLTVLMKRVDAS